jgi:hypothetical protein
LKGFYPYRQTPTFQISVAFPAQAATASDAFEAYRQSLQAYQKRGFDPGWITSEGDRIDPHQQFAEEDHHLDLDEVHSHAGVDAEAEAEMAVWISIGNERERALERFVIPVRRRIRHHEMVARPDCLVTEPEAQANEEGDSDKGKTSVVQCKPNRSFGEMAVDNSPKTQAA